MRKTVFVVFAGILAIALCAVVFQSSAIGSQAPAARDLTAAELAQVEAGEIILESHKFKNEAGETRGRGLAIGYIKASKDKIMDTLLDYPSYPQFMPRVKKTNVYLNTPTQVNVQFELKVMITIVYHIKHTVNRAAGTITWVLDKSKQNDIKDTTGSWVIKPYKDGCLVYYSVSLDTGRSVPGWLEDYLTKKDLPNVVNAVKKRIEG